MSPCQRIANVVREKLRGWTAEWAAARMRHHVIRLHLMSPDGTWAAPELEAIADVLLPSNIDKSKIDELVHRMAVAAEKNEYLQAFLVQASATRFDVLAQKVACEGDEVIPDAMAYAVVLERLTEAMRHDWRLIEVCEKAWKRARWETHALFHTQAFEVAKALSVERPMKQIVRYHKARSVPGTFARGVLPLNIAEAVMVDLREGYPANARAGWTLMVHLPGPAAYDPLTGAGPAHFSDDGKAIHLAMPLPLKWADLYSTWNMAFVTRYGHFPYVVAKLLIPEVAGYHDNPEEYLYRRVLALSAHVNWLVLGLATDAKSGTTSAELARQWDDPELRALWGRVNRESAFKYEIELSTRAPSSAVWVKKLTSMLDRVS